MRRIPTLLTPGLRLAEIVGLNVADVYSPDGTSRSRVRPRREIAKGGRTADVFLPDARQSDRIIQVTNRLFG